MILALAGRRIDPPDAVRERFPLQNVALVRSRLRELFENYAAATLVCSAACGADLLALEAAGALGWKRRVILPFDRNRFRISSVTDRAGDWGELYDGILDHVQAAGDLLLESAPAGVNEYEFASLGILNEAARLSKDSRESRTAVLVWDGTETGPDDMTASFAAAAKLRGIPLLQISTLE